MADLFGFQFFSAIGTIGVALLVLVSEALEKLTHDYEPVSKRLNYHRKRVGRLNESIRLRRHGTAQLYPWGYTIPCLQAWKSADGKQHVSYRWKQQFWPEVARLSEFPWLAPLGEIRQAWLKRAEEIDPFAEPRMGTKEIVELQVRKTYYKTAADAVLLIRRVRVLAVAKGFAIGLALAAGCAAVLALFL